MSAPRAAKLAPDVEATGGGGLLDRRRRHARDAARRPRPLAAGHGWLGLRENGDYIVAGVSEVPLLPGLLALLLALGLFLAAWRQEGR